MNIHHIFLIFGRIN